MNSRSNQSMRRDSRSRQWVARVVNPRDRSSAQPIQPLVLATLAILLLMAGVQTSSAGDAPPGEARYAAINSLRSFLEAIPLSDLHYFSLSRGDLPRASVGGGFRLNTIIPPVLEQIEEGADLASTLTQAPVFLFPVVVDDRMKALLTVEKRDGLWETVSIGGAGVAKQWDSITRRWDASSGFDHDFIRIYQAVADLVLVTPPGGFTVGLEGEGGRPALVLLDSAKMALSTEASPLVSGNRGYDPDPILALLKARVREAIDQFRESDGHQVLD